MSIQSLTPPQDITWTRLAYSSGLLAKFCNELILECC